MLEDIREEDLILLEKGLRLKAKTGFEINLLEDRLTAIHQYSLKTKISTAQRKVLEQLGRRYDIVHFGTVID